MVTRSNYQHLCIPWIKMRSIVTVVCSTSSIVTYFLYRRQVNEPGCSLSWTAYKHLHLLVPSWMCTNAAATEIIRMSSEISAKLNPSLHSHSLCPKIGVLVHAAFLKANTPVSHSQCGFAVPGASAVAKLEIMRFINRYGFLLLSCDPWEWESLGVGKSHNSQHPIYPVILTLVMGETNTHSNLHSHTNTQSNTSILTLSFLPSWVQSSLLMLSDVPR